MLSYDDIESVFSNGTFAQQFGFSRENAKELVSHGSELLEAGAIDQAVTMFEGLVVMNHRDAGNWACLGIAYLEGQRLDDAKAALQTALRLAPGHEIASRYLARIPAR